MALVGPEINRDCKKRPSNFETKIEAVCSNSRTCLIRIMGHQLQNLNQGHVSQKKSLFAEFLEQSPRQVIRPDSMQVRFRSLTQTPMKNFERHPKSKRKQVLEVKIHQSLWGIQVNACMVEAVDEQASGVDDRGTL